MSIFVKKDYYNNYKRYLDIIDTQTLEQKTVLFDEEIFKNAINKGYVYNVSDSGSESFTMNSMISGNLETGRYYNYDLDMDLKHGTLYKEGNNILLKVFDREYDIHLVDFDGSSLAVVTVNDSLIAERKASWIHAEINLVLYTVKVEANVLQLYFNNKGADTFGIYIFIDYSSDKVNIVASGADAYKSIKIDKWFYTNIVGVLEYCLDYMSPLNDFLTVKGMKIFLTVCKSYTPDDYIRRLLQLWLDL